MPHAGRKQADPGTLEADTSLTMEGDARSLRRAIIKCAPMKRYCTHDSFLMGCLDFSFRSWIGRRRLTTVAISRVQIPGRTPFHMVRSQSEEALPKSWRCLTSDASSGVRAKVDARRIITQSSMQRSAPPQTQNKRIDYHLVLSTRGIESRP